MRLVALLALFTAGCASLVEPEPGDRLTLRVEGVDPAIVANVLDEWRTRSDGRLDVEVVLDGEADAVVRFGDESGFSRPGRYIEVSPNSKHPDLIIDNAIGRILGMRTHREEGLLNETRMGQWSKADRQSCHESGWCP